MVEVEPTGDAVFPRLKLFLNLSLADIPAELPGGV
jgi:hypothetical protein